MESAIQVVNLSKTYRIYRTPLDRFVEKLPWITGPRHRSVTALQSVTFDLAPGQCLGIVGANGAGKSTLLKILCGTTRPSSGHYRIRGSVTGLLELGTGFHQEFTGRENIYMTAAIMGFSRRAAKAKIDEIIEFSGLGHLIDAPLRTYSSGMICRLGFSVAIAVEPDVLLIDEVFAVGDMHFQRRCVDTIWEYKRRGKTLVLCSHSLYDVRHLCEWVLWLHDGRVRQAGNAPTVTNAYADYQARISQSSGIALGDDSPAAPDDDTSLPQILAASIVDPLTGQLRNRFAPGQPVAVRVHIRNGEPPVELALGAGVLRPDGTICFAYSTQMEDIDLDFREGFVTLVLNGSRLLCGEYTMAIWLLDEHGVHRYHERPAEQNLIVVGTTTEVGLFRHEHRWIVEHAAPPPRPSA